MALLFPFRRLRRRKSFRARPRIRTLRYAETLEHRTLLAVFTVSTQADTFDALPGNGVAADAFGDASLRAAIQEANGLAGRDIIVLPSGTYTLNRIGTNEDAAFTGDLDVSSELLIMGAGAGRTIIDAADIDRVFDIRPGARLILTGVTIRNGTAVNGAGLRNSGTLELIDSTVTGNDALGAVNSAGGGIGNASGTLTLTRVTVNQNTAAIHGGGLYSSSGSIVINDSTFEENSAANDGGGLSIFNGSVQMTDSTILGNIAGIDGGGLSIEGADVTLTRVNVQGNTASEDGGGLNLISSGTLRLFENTVTGNTASTGFGGGIRNFGATLGVTGTTVAGNQAGRSGGGIDNDSGLAELTSSLLTANTAAENGAGLNAWAAVTGVSNSTISGNTAAVHGGGISNDGAGSITVVNSTVTANTATGGLGGGVYDVATADLGNTIVAGNFGAADGRDLSGSLTSLGNNLIGQIGLASGFVGGVGGDLVGTTQFPLDAELSPLQDNGGLTFSHSPLAGSLAIDAGNGNGVAGTDQTGQARVLDGDANGVNAVDIGAVEFRDGIRTFTVTVTTDSTDRFHGDGVALDSAGETSLRAAIQEANALAGESRVLLPAGVFQVDRFNFVPGLTEGNVANSSEIEDLDITGQLTITGAGRDQTFIDAGDLCRVLQVHPDAQVTLQNLTVRNGMATFGGGIYNGGGLLILQDAAVVSSTATGTDTLSHGGGITVENGSLSLTRTDVTDNTAAIDAGGVYAFNSNVFIEQSRIDQNSSGRSGGGLALVGSTVQFVDAMIADNSATDDGGGLAIGTGSSVILATSIVRANSTSDFGGGLHVIGATVSIVDSSVSGNSAAVSGGGINNEQGTVTFSRSTVSGNQAADAGGGIDNYQGLVSLNQTTVSGNQAASTGGGFVNFAGGTIEIQNSTVVSNSAGQTGGGLWNAGTVRVGNSIIAQNTSATAAVDVDGSVVSLGTNLIGVGDGSFGLVNAVAGNLVGTLAAPIDPGLSPLQDNGGATQSHLPLFGSAAIDAGTLFPGTTSDQRGRARVSGENLDSVARTDIGAVEFEGVSLTAVPGGSLQFTASREADELLISNSSTGRVLFRLKVDLIDQIQFNGAALNDSLIVDLSSGNPLPVGGFEFAGTVSGGTDLDSLTILTGSVQTASHTILSGTDGGLALDGRTVAYTRVESLVDSAAAQNREFLTGDAGDSLVFANTGTSTDGMMSLSRGTGTPLEFLATGSTLAVRDSGGVSIVRFDSVDDLLTAAVRITTGDQSDQIDTAILSVDVNVNSGAGNDTVVTGAGHDEINTGPGYDLIEAGAGNDTVLAGSQIDTIRGGAGHDVLLGQGGSRDVLTGGPGDDILHGGSGEDYLRVSGDLNYTLTDTTLTGEGNDILISLERAELTGGSGDNRIDASQYTGVTTIEGGAGNDTLIGGSGNDRIVDTVAGNDRLEGNGGSDILIAGQGRDTVLGGAGNDFVLGNGGSGDQLSGGPGADLVNGGGGNDILFETLDVAQLLLRDNRLIGDDTDRLFNIEQARLTGGAAANLFDAGRFTGRTVLSGMGGDDFLIGGKAADVIYGGEGNDSILGRAGNDTIYGEAGDDTLKGDGGDDLILGGTGNDGIAGRTDNDTLIGDLGEDTVLGNEGDDFVLGGGGNDTVYGGAGADRVIGNGGTDELGGGNPGQADPDPGDSISGSAAEFARIDDAFVATADWILNG